MIWRHSTERVPILVDLERRAYSSVTKHILGIRFLGRWDLVVTWCWC